MRKRIVSMCVLRVQWDCEERTDLLSEALLFSSPVTLFHTLLVFFYGFLGWSSKDYECCTMLPGQL